MDAALKRAAIAGSGGLGLLGACAGEPEAPQSAVDNAGWMRPPVVRSVTPAAGGVLRVVGEAEPSARVVLRGVGGEAFATSADPRGRFDLPIRAPGAPMFLTLETQQGAVPALAPELLLVAPPGLGPKAVLKAGAASRPLTDVEGLTAVDSDGRTLILSGRARPGTGPVTVVAGGRRLVATPDAQGYWSVVTPALGDGEVRIGERVYTVTLGPGDPSVEATPGGWRIRWSHAGTSQTTWLPRA